MTQQARQLNKPDDVKIAAPVADVKQGCLLLLELHTERRRAVHPQTENQTADTWYRHSRHSEGENDTLEESEGGDSKDEVDDSTAQPQRDVSLYGTVKGDILLSAVHKTRRKKGYTDVQEICYR